jgi:hypothetical protein
MERAMDKPIDTSRTVAIVASRFGTIWKLVWSIAGLLVAGPLTALLILLASQDNTGLPAFIFYVFAGIAAIFVLGSLVSIIECAMFLKISNNVLTISPEGIRDRRVTEEIVPWRAVRSVRTAADGPDYYLAHDAPGKVTPIRHTPLNVVLDIDPALISQALKQRAFLITEFSRRVGMRDALDDTRPWITFTIDLWRLKNITANALYDICRAYATAAQAKHAG